MNKHININKKAKFLNIISKMADIKQNIKIDK